MINNQQILDLEYIQLRMDHLLKNVYKLSDAEIEDYYNKYQNLKNDITTTEKSHGNARESRDFRRLNESILTDCIKFAAIASGKDAASIRAGISNIQKTAAPFTNGRS